MSVVNTRVYGGIRSKLVNRDVPLVLNSGVSLAEAVEVWVDSLRQAIRQAHRCPEWDWHFRVCTWRKRGE